MLLAALVFTAPASPQQVAASPSSIETTSSAAATEVETLLGSIDTRIPAARWRALGEPGVGALSRVVEDGEALPSRRARAVNALSLVGGARAKAVVLRVAQAETAPFAVRMMAIRGAPRVASAAELATALAPVLEAATAAPVRVAAAETLSLHAGAEGCALVRVRSSREGEEARALYGSALQRCAAQ